MNPQEWAETRLWPEVREDFIRHCESQGIVETADPWLSFHQWWKAEEARQKAEALKRAKIKKPRKRWR